MKIDIKLIKKMFKLSLKAVKMMMKHKIMIVIRNRKNAFQQQQFSVDNQTQSRNLLQSQVDQ